MPRFYFHLHNTLDVPDEEGQELPSIEAALRYAEICARVEVVETLKVTGRMSLGHRIDIGDDQGSVIDTIWFRDVVSIED